MKRRCWLVAVVVIGGCSGTTDPLQSRQQAVVSGSIEFLNFEGGCWAIKLSDDIRYQPTNLPDEFRKDGLSIRAELKRRDDLASICQFGTIVEIIWIRAG
ncbi:MAG: hypothetical protein ACE5HT_03470 [Gemmatimonadales bacterium]